MISWHENCRVSAPIFSVIVPTYNRPHQVRACLEKLASLDYDKKALEVILVDDGGACDLKSVVAPFLDRLIVKLERQPNHGPAGARNRGAASAAGDFLAFTDDDCEPERGWLRALEAQLLRHPGHAIGGRIVNVATDVYAAASHVMIDALYAHVNRDSPRFFASSNIAIRAGLFRDLGGFHDAFPLAAAEDREFCNRCLRRGIRLTYAPDAVVQHNHGMRLAEYWTQQFRYGRGALQYRRVVPEVQFERFAFYWEVIRRVSRESSGWKAAQHGWAVGLSQLAVATGYMYEAMLSWGSPQRPSNRQ